MKTEHLERLRPICPVCRDSEQGPAPLGVGTVVRADDDDVVEGILLCSNPRCQHEYPIIDGIPIVVAPIREYIAEHLSSIYARDDLSPLLDSMIADCAPDSPFDLSRYYTSTYAHTHYGGAEGGLPGLIEEGVALLSSPPQGVWLDAGCATGGGCFELAARTGDVVLGIDLNFSMLRFARKLARDGEAVYPLRRVGVIYDSAEARIDPDLAGQVALMACSALDLPFEGGAFDGALSLNLVDSITSPLGHLAELGRVLRQDAEAILCSPYDWSSGAAPLPSWIGGHSQRAESRGSSVAEMRRVLSDSGGPSYGIDLRLVADKNEVPWRMYVHERSRMEYLVHMMVARADHRDALEYDPPQPDRARS